MHVSRVTLARA
uniref:Uncharacterized protein n=1 Tax=Arundo donax TaxID=35708 RepID=A0A0A9C1C8_ARUDO